LTDTRLDSVPGAILQDIRIVFPTFPPETA